jgi:hypothetical protein
MAHMVQAGLLVRDNSVCMYSFFTRICVSVVANDVFVS